MSLAVLPNQEHCEDPLEILAHELFPGMKQVNTRSVFLYLARNKGRAYTNVEIAQVVCLSASLVATRTLKIMRVLERRGSTVTLSRRRRSGHEYEYICDDHGDVVSTSCSVELSSDAQDLLLQIRNSVQQSLFLMISQLGAGVHSLQDVGVSIEQVRELAEIVREFRYMSDFQIREVIDGLRTDLFEVCVLDDGVLQTVNFDFADRRYQLRRYILRFFGHIVGGERTVPEVTRGLHLDDPSRVRRALISLVLSSAIHEYRQAYGWSMTRNEKDFSPGKTYSLETVGERPIKERYNRKLICRPQHPERHMPRPSGVTGFVTTPLGRCPLTTDIPRDAEMRVRRGSCVLRAERGELLVVQSLLDAAREGHACAMWPFAVEFDVVNGRMYEELIRRTHAWAVELGFVVEQVADGYCSVFFLDDEQREILLNKKYENGEELPPQFSYDLLPFDHGQLLHRISPMITAFRTKGRYGGGYDLSKDVFPPWMPSQLHYDVLLAVGRAQRDGNLLTVLDAAILFGVAEEKIRDIVNHTHDVCDIIRACMSIRLGCQDSVIEVFLFDIDNRLRYRNT